MSEASATRVFKCSHCGAGIEIPANLPPTTAPCPKCKQEVTSPAFEEEEVPVLEPLKEENPIQDSGDAAGSSSQESSVAEGKKLKNLPVILSVVALVVLGAGVVKVLLTPDKKKNTANTEKTEKVLTPEERVENAYRSHGWVEDAQDALKQFFEADTIKGRSAVTVRGVQNEGEMAAIYQDFNEQPHRTPVDAFSSVALGEQDAKRGIYLMSYNRPRQFAIGSFFRPIPPLRVKYGLEEPDNLLVSEGAVNNFIDQPLRILAFFKKTSEGMKLDWQTYVQTKYRLLDRFVSRPERGRTGVFRVFVQEDIDLERRNGPGQSVYRFVDPANPQDFAKILVEDESELGKALSPLKWTDRAVSKAPVKNATVSLKWSDEDEPSLQMGELICWEFLGLGGERGNWK